MKAPIGTEKPLLGISLIHGEAPQYPQHGGSQLYSQSSEPVQRSSELTGPYGCVGVALGEHWVTEVAGSQSLHQRQVCGITEGLHDQGETR